MMECAHCAKTNEARAMSRCCDCGAMVCADCAQSACPDGPTMESDR